ncbi:type VII secretion target [Amycolatopsis suaedae]|uniref:WXG100 family type VII secretion target n=1 Tax=Amycolatopsis suaedae TaxID=2510978 RepID=A0A4Q7J691_9PSEU|nr:type VII secretion target [Amycolatopsis suaedae]RZQ62398.1 WXG100 family type VII secretion target [Amycolatopsis suaedae]
MTTPSYQVDPEQLRSHAGRLAAHADRLSAIGTSLPGEMNAASLGSFAQFITTGVGAAMARTSEAFGHASSTMDKVSEGMRRAAEHYQHSDDDHAAGLTGIGEGIR